MSVSKSNHILSIYKSRKNILDILYLNLNYDVKDYENFSINEIDAMYTNSQLDMLLSHKTNGSQIPSTTTSATPSATTSQKGGNDNDSSSSFWSFPNLDFSKLLIKKEQ